MNFKVEWRDRLSSTNTYMKDLFSQGSGIMSGAIVAAREQTAGRGRSDRKWVTAPDANLCCSLFIETDRALMDIPSLTMAAALAIAEHLNALNIPATPKWPNDVLVGGKKICGILSERVTNAKTAGVIVGMGLNINMTSEEAATIDRPATSLLIETGRAANVSATLDALLPYFDHWISEWNEGGFANLREIWTERAGPIGKSLSVHDGEIKKTGTLAGFGEHGELLLATEHGVETIWSGDVT